MWDTVSAFANTSGGTIILGLDETEDFSVVPELAVESIANQLVNGLDPKPGAVPKVTPVPEIRMGEIMLPQGGVVVLEVDAFRQHPRLLPHMPCFVTAKGIKDGSFKRVFDHDQRLSAYEIHELQSRGHRDGTDRQPVDGAVGGDINQSAATDLINRLKAQGSRIADGAVDEIEILTRLNVFGAGGAERTPTFSGLMSLGWYPQQFYPQLFIDVTAHPGAEKSTGDGGVRFDSRRICDGAMPVAIENAVTEVLSHLRTRYREAGPGIVEEKEIPDIAVREAVANAVMHRDYGDLVRGQQIAVDIYPDRVEVTNPGGLWGDRTVENLSENRSMSRNEALARLLSQVVDSRDNKVAENQGSGIQRMIGAMRSHGLPAPQFSADIGSFKVIMPRFGLIGPDVQTWLEQVGGGDNRSQDVALVIARDQGSVTPKILRQQLGIDSDDARMELSRLVEQAKLSQIGPERYALVSDMPELTKTEIAVLNALSFTAPRTARQVSEEMGKTVTSVRIHLRVLVEKKLVVATAPPTSRNRSYLRAR